MVHGRLLFEVSVGLRDIFRPMLVLVHPILNAIKPKILKINRLLTCFVRGPKSIGPIVIILVDLIIIDAAIVNIELASLLR